jgi:hypothetical protein
MAKRCAVCHKTYSDNLSACPHCKAAAQDSGVGVGQQPPRTAGEEAASDQALAALLGEDEVIEVLGEDSSPSGKRPAEATAEEPAALEEVIEIQPEDSSPSGRRPTDVAPPGAPAGDVAHTAALAPASESVVEGSRELSQPTSNPSGQVVVTEPAGPPAETVTVAGEGAADVPPPPGGKPAQPTMLAGPGAVANLPGHVPEGPTFVVGVPDLELESKVHKEAKPGEPRVDAEKVPEGHEASGPPTSPPPAPHAAPPVTAAEDAGVLDEEEILDVTEEASGASGREYLGHGDVLDAEEVVEGEEPGGPGVDLIAETVAPAHPDRLASEVDLGAHEPTELASSHVNVVSPASPSEKDLEDLLRASSSEGIDTGYGAEARARAAPAGAEEHRAAPPETETETFSPEPAAALAEDEEVAPLRPKKEAKVKAPKPRRGRYVALGALLGILLLAGAAVAVWFVEPARLIALDALGLDKKRPIISSRPAPSPVERAHEAMDRGDYAEAVTALEGAPNANDPDVAGLRGQARWMKYLQEKHKQKQPPSINDPGVKEVLKDVKAANNPLLTAQVMSTLKAKQLDDQLAAARQQIAQLQKAGGAGDKTLAAIAQALGQNPKDINPAKVGALVKQSAQAQKALGAIAGELKVPPDAVDKAVQQLAATRADLDAKLKEVDAKLKDAKVEGAGPAGVAQLVESRNKLEKERADLDAAVKAAVEVLREEKLVPPDAEPGKALVEGTKAALDRTRAPLVTALGQVASVMGNLGSDLGGLLQGGFDTGKLAAELAYYRTREPLIQTPEQKLDTWAALFRDRSYQDNAGLNAAANEARWVLSDTRASADAKAKAHYVLGLVDRNRGKLADARQELDQAVKAAAGAKASPWAKAAGQALTELADPATYYLPRAQRLRAAGDFKGALAELDGAVQANPEDGTLRVVRGLVRLEMPRSSKLDPKAQQLIRQDAETARKDPKSAAEGSYLLGRLEEELGNLDAAETDYREALKAHQGSPEEASRYIIALARVLQRERGAAPEEAPATEPEPKVKDAKDNKVGLRSADPRLAILSLALTGVQAPGGDESPGSDARLRESMELAKKLIDSADPKIKGQGYILMGQALSRQGDRTEGLRLYAKGMKLAYPELPTKNLLDLVQQHPALQPRERAANTDSYQAERHFGEGLHRFWAGQYAAAEEEFRKAVGFFPQDARYEYYLGLSQVVQNTDNKLKAGRRHIQEGVRLEAQNLPGPVTVNASLERLQGPLRQYLDAYRQRAPAPGR